MEELSTAEKAAIDCLKVDLDHEVVVRSSRDKELAQLREELDKRGWRC